MLGSLLFVGTHLLLETQIFGVVAAARMRPGNRTVFELAASDTDQHLRRRSQNLRVPHPQEIKIRRRIHLAQSAVKIERLDSRDEIEALRKYNLKNVARGDVFLAALDAAKKLRRVVPA